MDTRTGEIMPESEALRRIAVNPVEAEYLKQIETKLLSKKAIKEFMATGSKSIKLLTRCPCGSGKIFKNCCYTIRAEKGAE